MLDTVPWFIGGEAEHSPAVARMVAHAATNGSNGIIQARDLQVRALSVPGTQVQIYPGQAVLRNEYPGGEGQSYMVRNITATNVDVPATSSTSGVTWYVILRIEDPEFSGQYPADPATAVYVFPTLVKNKNNLAYPHVVLAKIVMPASTGTIEQSMITDLRNVANPREKTIRIARPSVGGDNGLRLGSQDAAGEWFPNTGNAQAIPVPEWATRVQITATWISVKYDPSTAPYGQYWVEYGPAGSSARSTQRFRFDSDANSDSVRVNWIAGDDVYVPWDYRGTEQPFIMKARYESNRDGARLDASSGIILDVRFLEVADLEGS